MSFLKVNKSRRGKKSKSKSIIKILKSGILISLCVCMLGSDIIMASEVSGTTTTESDANANSTTGNTTGNTTGDTSGSAAADVVASDGTAAGRAKVFIRKAAGKNIVSDTEALAQMSKEDLKFLGVYISNFFIPFGTEFGVNAKMNDQNKEDIVSALRTNLNYDEATATSLAETIIGLSRSNNSELVFCVSDEYQKEIVPLDDMVLNSYTMIQAMSGRLPEVMKEELPNESKTAGAWVYQRYVTESGGDSTIENPVSEDENEGTATQKTKWNIEQNLRIIAPICDEYEDPFSLKNFYTTSGYEHLDPPILMDEDPLVKDNIYNKKSYNYGYFAYKNGNSYTPVFDFHLYEEDGMTACQLAFWKCLEAVNFEKGYGLNLFDFSKSEVDENDGFEGFSDYFSSDDDWYKMSTFGSRLRVDCFGNIIVMGSNHQFVGIPACVNPYTWQVVDSEGNDDTTKPRGSVYNMINLMSLTYYDDKRMFTNVKGTDIKTGYGATKALVNRLGTGKVLLRAYRGSDQTDFGGGITGLRNTSLSEALENARNGANANNDYCTSVAWSAGIPGYTDSKKVVVRTPSIDDGKFAYSNKKKIKFIDSLVFIDNLAAFHFDNSNNDIDWDNWNALNVDHYCSPNSDKLNDLYLSMGSGFENTLSSITDGKMSTISSSDINKEGIVAVYISYLYAGLFDENNKKDTIGKLGYRMSDSIFPDITNDPIGSSGALGDDVMTTSIKQWLYYLLHPTSGYNYVTELISNKMRAFFVDWHNDMLGTKGVGNIVGTTKYRGTTGYVTTPDLSEMEWTDKLISLWEDAISYVAILVLVVFAFVYLAGILSIQKCIIGVIIFCVGMLIPVPMINGVVGVSNRLVSNMYGEKFTYWAMIQHETYSDAIDEAASGDSYSNYLRTIYNQNSATNVNQGSESIKLKWQAPKKMASLMLSSNDNNTLSGLRGSLITGAINNAFSGEAYMDDDSCYLYRSYLDISNFSRYIYRGIKEGVREHSNSVASTGLQISVRNALNDIDSKLMSYKNSGYVNYDVNHKSDNGLHVVTPMSSYIYSNAIKKAYRIPSLNIDEYAGINQDFFNFSIPMFNKKDSTESGGFTLESSLRSSAKSTEFASILDSGKYSESDFVGLASYGLYSESVFYYYSWYLYDCGMSTDSSANTGYKDLILGGDNAEFFYNVDGNGELKDIMDMKSLFTYIIPYLNEGNRLVRGFDKTYGLKYYPGVSTEEGHQDEYKSDPELKQKYWQNLNVSRLYEIYTPWVDLMYDCSYAKPETIKVMGENYIVKNPINPATYPEERPMIFSRSEMADYGLHEGDLTKVERLILKCNDEFQEALFDLLNYHSFNDVVLNTAAAMNCAFIFNKNFSESNLLGNNIDIYPQSFEISDFSYDAFLRFVLANSTGESMLNNDDFYMNIVQSSSLTTILVMIILDIASVYILPGIKIFFIVLIFLSSLLVIFVSLLHVDEEQKFIPRLMTGVISPMIKYFLISMGMSYLISLFMGVGNDSVTQSNTLTIQLGDPVMVMVAMFLIDVIAIVLYYKTLKAVWQSIKRMGKLVGSVGSGCVAAVGGFLSGAFVGSAVAGGGGSGRGATSSVNGSGTSSARAERRGTSNLSDSGEAKGSGTSYRGEDEEYDRGTDRDYEPYRDTGSGNDYDEEYSRSRSLDIEKKTKSGLEKARQRRRDDKRVDRAVDRAMDKRDKEEAKRERKQQKADEKDRRRDSSNKSNEVGNK